MMTPKIQHGVLMCPACGSGYLHVETVCVFARRQDNESVYVGVDPGSGTVDVEPDCHPSNPLAALGNPSRRRHGQRLVIRCEECPEYSYLTIAQHKGQTLIEHRADSDSRL